MKNKLKQTYPVFFITIVVFLSISLLALVNEITAEKRADETEKKIQAMLAGMFPEMSRFEIQEDVYILFDGSERIGFAYIAEGNGYAGYISILVGLEDAATIKGISIISHTESPGLGERITEDEYKGQFSGLTISDSRIIEAGGKIDAITGATISSRAVADAVRETALEKVEALFGEGGN